PAFLDDYAFMIWGLLELYETTFDPVYLEKANTLNKTLLANFWDTKSGGFFFTANEAETLLVRKKDAYDGAIPSGNSVAMLNLLRLGRITASSDLEAKAARIGRAFSGDVLGSPAGFTLMISAVDFAVGPAYELVLVGNPKAKDTQEMVKAVTERFIPNKVVLMLPEGEEERIKKLASFTKDYSSINGNATAFVCSNHQCQLPTTDIQQMLSFLKEQ
ncbi:MAG: thioredoxin domain-containing protein, partial [Promethearchaeota archaeon]